MSTTFEVYPGTERIPTFREVADLTGRNLREFLRRERIDVMVPFTVGLYHGIGEVHEPVPLDLDAPAVWTDDQYAWFSIPNIAGGMDAYFRPVKQFGRDQCMVDVVSSRGLDESWQNALHKALEVGHYWSLRRSAGQPGLIAVGYGMLAAALAELTGGFVYTDDGAWDYKRFPAWPQEMMTWYFRPEMTEDEERKDWSGRLLRSLRKEIRDGGYLPSALLVPTRAAYWEPAPIDREAALAHLYSDDPVSIGEVLIRLSYHDPDWRWVQNRCIAVAYHDSAVIRSSSAICFGHLARIHGTLDLELVEPVLRRLRQDSVASVAGNAVAAQDDIDW